MIIVHAGSDTEHTITARETEGGSLIDLTGTTLIFQIRRYPGAVPELEKTTGAGIVHDPDQATTGKGLAVLTIPRADVPDPGWYRTGLWLVDALGNRQPLRELGWMRVYPSVVEFT